MKKDTSRFLNLFRPSPNLRDIEGNYASFYCSDCDGGSVKSNDSATGLFFILSGHEWESLTHNSACVSDHYGMFVIALCHECLERTGFRELLPQE